MRPSRSLLPLLLLLPLASASLEDVKDVQLSVHNDNVSDLQRNNFVPGSSKKLTEHLLGQHNMNAPPDGILDVHYEMELVHILGIDELKQTMTALVYVDEKWQDPSLSWNPEEFGGLTKTWLPMHRIWLPDIIIFNMLHHEDLLSKVRAPAMIYANGTVECSHPAVYTVSCEINIKHFPLDDQRCSLEIASWAYNEEKIRLHAHIEHSLEHYSPNEEWRLLNVTVHEQDYEHEGILVSEIRYDISVRRKPLFYMVTLTFPSYVMCAISVVGLYARFSTTGEREERFTLGVTAILTMAVLSLVVSEKVPHSSTSVPLLVAYFLFNMVVVSLAAMMTGLVMRVHRMGRHGDEPPRWALSLFLLTPRSHKDVRGNCWQTTFGDQLIFEQKCVENGGTASRKVQLLEAFVRKLIDVCENTQNELDDVGHEDVRRTVRMRHEANGFVRISERLDWIFMLFFLVLVTVPVVVLFALM
uniref:Neur_chan_LBD domain-containing protein n=1 Tax=Steinernema glaseri TaxID=37863 RepID=A0A1I7YZ38_9BILA